MSDTSPGSSSSSDQPPVGYSGLAPDPRPSAATATATASPTASPTTPATMQPQPSISMESIDIELRRIVQEAVSTRDVQSKIREATMRVLAAQNRRQQNAVPHAGPIREDELVEELLRDGLVELVKRQCAYSLATLSTGSIDQQGPEIARSEGATTEDRVVLTVLQGKAFLEHADTPTQHFLPHREPKFLLHAFFQGQRVQSRAVPCSADPVFNHSFSFRVPVEVENPLLLREPILLALVRVQPEDTNVLVSTHRLQWQDLLLRETDAAVEMSGVGQNSAVPAGVLTLKLRLDRNATMVPLDREATVAKLAAHRNDGTRCERLFLLYAKQWWKEFLDIRPNHAFRLVKIFVPDECGVKRLITLTVKPIRPGRLIDTPREAARFVSLLACEKIAGVGSGKVEQWADPHTFLCSRVGDVEDHATLLCGLLLGLGADAYVCVGTKSVRRDDTGGRGTVGYTWVVTYGANRELFMWDPLSGERWRHGRGKGGGSRKSAYDTIGCIFNNTAFFANIQPSDFLDECSMDISDASKWKAMSRDAIGSVTGSSHGAAYGPPLLPNGLDVLAAAGALEVQLRSAITQHRRTLGLGATWNAELAPILVQCLAAYELEKRSGVVDETHSQDFQHSIKRAIPKGHTFKGFPVQFTHTNADVVMAQCLQDPLCSEIIDARGDQVLHSVHVKIVPYPDDQIAVWLLLCVTYRSVL